jgi:hypothetical protein
VSASRIEKARDILAKEAPASEHTAKIPTEATGITEGANDMLSNISDGVHESNDDSEGIQNNCEDSAAL